MELTPRAAEIILLLTQQPQGYPLTLSAVSEQLQVSRRTLQRVLPEIRDWMDKNGYRFSARAGQGLSLDEPEERRRAIVEALGARGGGSAGRGRETRGLLIGLLLDSDIPLKIAWLARQCELSEGSTEKELDEVSLWLARCGVKLCRRAGVGVYVECGEDARRLAIEAAVDEFTSPSDLLGLLRGTPPTGQRARYRLTDHVAPEMADEIGEILEEAERRLDVHLTDSGFMGLFVHIALAVQRVREGNLIRMEADRLARLRLLPEYAVAEFVTDRLQAAFAIHLPPDETGFVTMHLAGSRIWQRETPDRTEAAELDALHLTLQMTEVMERRFGMRFRDSERLVEGLCSHLYSVCSRLRLGTPIDHPQLSEVKHGYPELFAAACEACALLAREVGVDEVPEAEAAYIAMHFGAVMEEQQADETRVTAVVVCPTGIGTSRLLAAELRRAFPSLLICDVMSAMRIDTEQLTRRGIDLILSTMELDIKFRYIRVSPVLTERDRVLVGAVLDAIRQQKPVREEGAVQPKALLGRLDVRFISTLGEELFSLLDALRLVRAPILKNRAALMTEAAQLFAEDARAANDIELAFVRRDQLSDTYIKPFHALLLHCRTPFAAHCRFGYVRLEPPFYENGRVMLGAIVMLLPEEDETSACAALMSEVSGLLMRRPALLEHMRAGDEAALAVTLEDEFMNVYRAIVRKRLGGAEHESA